MPRFDSTGSLQVTYTDKSFGVDALSFNTMTLLGGVPSESQVEVRYNTVQYSTDSGLLTTYGIDDEVFGLDADTKDKFRTLSNTDAVFAGGAEITFNEANSTVVVPAPVSMSFSPPVVVGGVEFPTLYYVNPAMSIAEPVELRRSTDVTTPVVEYQSGSRLTSDLLNLSSNQNLFAVQELTEYGALATESGGSGGGSGSGLLVDLTGAVFLASDGDGNVIWENNQLRSRTDAPGILPLADGLADDFILVTDGAAASATGTEWKRLTTDLVLDTNASLTLDQLLLALNDKAQFFNNGGAAGLLVNGGSTSQVTVTNVLGAPAVQITLDGVTTIEDNTTINGTLAVTENATLPLVNGSAPLNATSSINDLSDVDTTTAAPTDGQALVWVDANSQWEPGDVAESGTSGPQRFLSVANTAAASVTATTISYLGDYTSVNQFGDTTYKGGLSSSGGWAVPTGEASRFRISAEARIMPTGAAGTTVNVSMAFQVNGTQVGTTAQTRVQNDSGADYQNLHNEWVLDLADGDVVTVTTDTIEGTTHTAARWNVIVLNLEGGTSSEPMTSASATPAAPVRVGTRDDGKPIYEATYNWSGGFATGVTLTIDPNLGNNGLTDRQLERVVGMTARDGTSASIYESESGVAIFGFYVSTNSTTFSISRSTFGAVTTGFGTGSYGTVTYLFTLKDD